MRKLLFALLIPIVAAGLAAADTIYLRDGRTIRGTLLGFVSSLFAGRAVRSLLFQVPEHDPWTFAVVLPCLLLVALAAAWIPSRRAAGVDPMIALRHE